MSVTKVEFDRLSGRLMAASKHHGQTVDEFVAALQNCGRDPRCAATLLKYGIPQKLSTMGLAMEEFAEAGKAILALASIEIDNW